MTEIFGALSVRKDPVSRTSTAAWQKAFPTLSAGITEATLPLFTAAGVKAQFRLNDDWMARIAKANSANPKGAQIFNPAFGVFVSERVIQCMPHEGNLLRLSRVEVVKDSVRGYVRTYNVNDAPPAGEDFMSRPDLWMKGALIDKSNDFLNPYQGDLYWPLITDGTEVYTTLDKLEQWPVLPMTVTVGSYNLNGRTDHVYPADNIARTYLSGEEITINEYCAIGCWIWGHTQDNLWVALRVVGRGNDVQTFYTSWQLATPSSFGPV